MWVLTFNAEQFYDGENANDDEDNEDEDEDIDDCNDPDGWVCLMILFSPFDGSPLLNYWSTKRSIDDDSNDDDDAEEEGEEDGECVQELLSPSSLLCLALWVLAPPQRTYN